MGLKKYKLGGLIELVEETNSNGLYGPEDVRGISNLKEMMRTKADLNGRDLSKFQIVRPGNFVFNHRTSRNGSKFSITYNYESKPFIFTEDYVVFRIKEECNDVLLKEWLYMYFCRSEFDRFVITNSWGSSTEFYNWQDLCDLEITLPSLALQRKFVNVYLALQNNLAVYQSKAEDLKLVCDGYLDKLKDECEKMKVGDLLEAVDKRNTELKLSGVQGININKQFFPTVANIDESSTRNYKIVEQNQFAFSGMQTGRDKCIRIALNEEERPIIVSPAYTVLKIMDEDRVLTHYIMMWFSRKQIDRYGWFASDASIRSNLDLERFYEMSIPIPDISVQREIVNIHKCYIERQRIAARLKEQLNNLCPILIKGSLETEN